MNPWLLLLHKHLMGGIPQKGAMGERPMGPPNPMQMGRSPLSGLLPHQNSGTFMAGQGLGNAHQSQPYDESTKRMQRRRDLSTPDRAFSSEGVGRNNE